MILSCQQISLAFGTEVILDKISFHIEEHEKTAIVGINGAGKSTLLKLLMRFWVVQQGSVHISDTDISAVMNWIFCGRSWIRWMN